VSARHHPAGRKISLSGIHQALPNQLTFAVASLGRPSMTPPQFHIGQTVYLRPSAFTRNAAAGMYEVRAVLPEEDGRRRYRIKSLIEPHERVVSENELSEA
jgi:hypothetical protein